MDIRTPINAALRYQKLKIIQNTVRIPASLYTSDLSALSVYQYPVINGVNWNQMSDRAVRHYQPPTGGGGGGIFRGSSTRHTQTGVRPGSCSPGGLGVDIKHNSYYRYLARLKGSGPVRRGTIPPDFGGPIPFNNAFPIYGGKTVKTNIVDNCNCNKVK
jgi:hypothetical protein